MAHFLRRAVEIIHDVSIAHAVLGLLALVAETLFPEYITTSSALRVFIAGGAIVGGPLSFFRTGFSWRGKGRPKCVQRGSIYIVLWIASYLVLIIFPILLLRPQIAEKHPSLRSTREFLLDAMPLTNSLIFLGAFLASYFLVGAIVLSSANLANPRHNC